MTVETHHQAGLIETARLELERAHRAALALDSGEIRRGVQLALDALREAMQGEASVPQAEMLPRLSAMLGRVLVDLQEGRLAELGMLLEAARKELAG